MANAFGAVSPGDTSTLLPSQTAPLYDAFLVQANRRRFRRELMPLLEKANSWYVPSGFWPARGWLLLRRKDYVTLDPYSTRLALQINDLVHGNITFNNLTVVGARCATTGKTSDEDAILLVEVTDRRGILFNRWFRFPTSSQYNIRAPVYPTQFYEGSLNSGSTWTWSTMLQNLWNQMSTFLGSFPGLPTSPTGTPTGWLFPGVPAWEALCRILTLLGLTVRLTSTSTYEIVQIGAADASFDNLVTTYSSLVEEDEDWIDTGSGRVPGTVWVCFNKVNEFYGTEETIRRDTLQWTSVPFYYVPVSAPAPFTSAVGTHHLWDDFLLRVDVDGAPLAADVTTATSIAAQRAQQYYDWAYRGTLGSLRRIYAGALPFVAGPRVDGVCWRMDFTAGRKSWVTEVVRGPQPPFPEVALD